jgi:hypothetical protein
MRTPQVPGGKRVRRYRISRGTAVIIDVFIISLLYALKLPVLPWLLSLLTPHIGRGERGPAAWNIPGLFPVVGWRFWPSAELIGRALALDALRCVGGSRLQSAQWRFCAIFPENGLWVRGRSGANFPGRPAELNGHVDCSQAASIRGLWLKSEFLTGARLGALL